MNKLKEDLEILRALYDKRDSTCIQKAQIAEKNNEHSVKILNLTKHRVYEKVVGDLDDILEEYFSI